MAIGSASASVPAIQVPQGTFWHLTTEQGVLRVLRPRGYRPEEAAVVLYVHGFRTTIDRTWEKNRLSEQFVRSGQNAIFIGVDGPQALTDRVRFPNLEEVLQRVERETALTLPRDHLVALGHSGGYWTIASWLRYPGLESVVLLDGLYGFVEDYYRWISKDPPLHRRKLIFVARGTKPVSLRLVERLKGVVLRPAVPARYEDFSPRERRARVVHLVSQYSHRGIVTSGKVIPVVLPLTRRKEPTPNERSPSGSGQAHVCPAVLAH